MNPQPHRTTITSPTIEATVARHRLLVVAALAVGVYVGTLGNGLVWDDPRLYEVLRVRVAEGGAARLLAAPFALAVEGHTGYYRPVMLASLWFDSLFGAHTAFAAHLTNVVLHAACSVLVCLLIGGLGFQARGVLVAGLLFAVHPVHVESVAFVSGRTDLLAAFFLLLASVMWLRARAEPQLRPGLVVTGSGLAFLLACLSKESAWLLPGVLLAWDALAVAPGRRSPAAWLARNGRWIVLWGLVLAVVMLLRLFVAQAGLPFAATVRDPSNADWSIGAVPSVLATYARLLVVPWPLNAFYLPAQVRITILSACCVAILGAGAAWTASARQRRAGLASLVWIVLFLAPVCGIVPIGSAIVAERFLYIPSVGLAILLAALLRRSDHRMLLGAVLLVLVAMATATVVRARVWRDEVSLFESLARTSPDYPEGRMNLAIAYGEMGRRQEAIAMLVRISRERPESDVVQVNLGVQYASLGELESAIRHFRLAVSRNPRSVEALFNLGLAEIASGRPAQGEAALRACLEIDSTRAPAWHSLGVALLQQGRARDAESALRSAIRFAGESSDAEALLGHALLEQARVAEARDAFGRALALEPRNATALYGAGLAEIQLGRPEAARQRLGLLRELDPGLADRLSAALTEPAGSR